MTIYALPLLNKLSGNYTKTVNFTAIQCKANNQYHRKMGVGKDNLQVSYELKYIGLTQSEVTEVENLFSVQSLGDVLSFKSPIDSFARNYAKPASWQKENYFGWAKDKPYQKLTDLSFTLVLGNELTAIARTPVVASPTDLSVIFPSTGYNVALSSGLPDLYYKLTVLSGSTVLPTDNAYVASSGYYAGSVYYSSKWLSILPNSPVDIDHTVNGVYRYRLLADLSAFDHTTVKVTGSANSDNDVELFVNGVSKGKRYLLDFSLTGTDFIAGVNTIDFVVTNIAYWANNPTGLAVRIDSRAGTLL